MDKLKVRFVDRSATDGAAVQPVASVPTAQPKQTLPPPPPTQPEPANAKPKSKD